MGQVSLNRRPTFDQRTFVIDSRLRAPSSDFRLCLKDESFLQVELKPWLTNGRELPVFGLFEEALIE